MIPAVLMGLLLSAGVVSADETAAAGAAHKDVSSLIPDAPDTDGDGIADMYEKQIGTNYLDPRSVPLDMDGDGIPDDLDDDTDGDGVPDHKDAFPLIRLEWSDLDGDGLGDNIDSDRDNDGISNDNELRVGTDPNDAADVPPDGDRDLIPDSIDDDWDNDGSENSLDAFPYDPHEWRDLDKDGIGDHVDTVLRQMGRRADARQHQQLGRVDGGGGDDHLAPGLHHLDRAAAPDLDARGAAVLDHDLAGEAAVQGQVRAFQRRAQVGRGRRPARDPAPRAAALRRTGAVAARGDPGRHPGPGPLPDARSRPWPGLFRRGVRPRGFPPSSGCCRRPRPRRSSCRASRSGKAVMTS